MAHRYRQQSIVPQQPLDASHGLVDEHPGLPQQIVVPCEAVVVADQCQQLSVAVVLHQPIRAFLVHAAGHEAVRALMRRVPLDELANLFGAAHAQQRRAHHGAVANPRARVTPRSRLQGGTGAGHQNVRGGSQRGTDRLPGPAIALPLLDGKYGVPSKGRLGDGVRRAGRCVPQSGFTRLMGCRRQCKFERAGGEPEGIMRLRERRQGSAPQIRGHEALIETQRCESLAGASAPPSFTAAITAAPLTCTASVAPRQSENPADAAEIAKALPGRGDLKRAHQHEQSGVQSTVRQVLQPIVHPRGSALRRLGSNAQAPLAGFPDHRGHRHPPIEQFLARVDIGPGEQTAPQSTAWARARTTPDRLRTSRPH